MDYLISIIVPVYKAEKYIDRCVKSIISQTYRVWELILIDDGSPDSSGELCEKWSKRDNRIRVIHKNNGGVSSARNLGIENASGNWVTFVDSDDWISPNYLAFFIDNLKYGERTMYLQGIQMFTVHRGLSPMFSYEDKFYAIKENINFFTNDKILANGCPVAKLFSLKILRDNNIRFEESISINEDHICILTYYNYVDNICTISNISYYYYYDFTVSSLTKIKRSYTELHKVSSLIFNAYNSLCSKLGMTKEEQSLLYPIFGPNQAMEALLSSISNQKSISSFIFCENYLVNKFGYDLTAYNVEYWPFLKILSFKIDVRLRYIILKQLHIFTVIKNRIKYLIKIFLWRKHIKENKI